MVNPPLFEAAPEKWRGVLFGDGMSKVNIGVNLINCDATASVLFVFAEVTKALCLKCQLQCGHLAG